MAEQRNVTININDTSPLPNTAYVEAGLSSNKTYNQEQIDSKISNSIDGVALNSVKPTDALEILNTLPNAVYRAFGEGTYQFNPALQIVQGSAVNVIPPGYSVKFLKDASGWSVSVVEKLPMQDLTILENKVSNKLDIDIADEVMNVISSSIPFVLKAGAIVPTDGTTNTSINWLHAIFESIRGNTIYKLKGYNNEASSGSRRVAFFYDDSFLSIQTSVDSELIFTSPEGCNRILVQVASSDNIASDIPNSIYWEQLKLFAGENDNNSTTLKAEKIVGTISTEQMQSIEKSLDIENEIFKSKFRFTDKVGVNSFKSISMTGVSDVNHLNFAATKENNLSILIVKISSMNQTAAATSVTRLGFGDINGGFLLVQAKTTATVDVYEMSNHGVISIGGFNMGETITLNVGDVITVRRTGGNCQYYINNKLRGYYDISTSGYCNSYNSGLIGFRDYNSRWTATNIVTKERPSPYMHISIDDTIQLVRELTINTYTSIFENPRFAFYKQMHEKYGVCFSFYLFYQNSNASFDLTQVPVKYKAEFIANSSWLKFGFHGIDSTTNYSTIDKTTMVEHYNRIINEIIRFASISNLDVIPRFSMFGGNTENLIELKKYGIKGLLTADDTRELNAGLTETEKSIVLNSDDYYAYDRDLYYVRTEYRLDNATADSVVTQLNNLRDNVNNSNIYEMFYHEGKENNQAGKGMIEAMIKWAYDNRIRFDYPQNNIFY